jgi:tetratricopeptide (TPR) repeat protein
MTLRFKFSVICWIEIAAFSWLVLIYGWITYQRNIVWKSDLTLWSDIVEKSPQKVRPHNNLAVACNHAELFDRAITEAEKTLRLKPDLPNAFVCLGNSYIGKGSIDMAIMYYKQALSLNPAFATAYVNLGNAYIKKGLVVQAIAEYKKSLAVKFDYAPAHVNLASAYGLKGFTEKAIAEYKIASELEPDNPDIHYNLGLAYEQLAERYNPRAIRNEQNNLINMAIEHYEEALRINPADTQARESMMKLRAKGN